MATIFDRRSQSKETPVWEVVCDTMTWANGEGHAQQSETIGINGIIKQIVVTYSAATDDPDAVLTITDLDDNVYLTKTDDDGQTKVYDADGTDFTDNQLAFNGFKVKVDPSADSGATSLTADITIRGL